jgi:hypothetical protein
MSFLITILILSNFYLAQTGIEPIQIQSDSKLYCDRAYEICLTEICTSPDPIEKKKCMDRCYRDLKECEKR